MRETLKMMKSILTGKESKANEKELIEKYQEYLLPNILAYFYVNNYGIISNTSRLYPLLLDEDKASFCLQELDRCLLSYDFSTCNKFITYFIKCYKNKLRTETETMMTQKRKSIFSTANFADYEESLLIEDNIENIDLVLNNYNLKTIDKKQCKLAYMGYNFKEISLIFNQAPITIYKRNQKIKEKIKKYYINFA